MVTIKPDYSENILQPIILELVLNFDWFDQFVFGEKTIEYRRICPHWSRHIWDRRELISLLRIRRGYTQTTALFPVTKIDIGPCPYPEFTESNYYRIHTTRRHQS